ncbi:MAG: sulfurtransferase TusA family protein [Pseudomonadota bacterium]
MRSTGRGQSRPLAPGDVLDVLTDDPAAIVDVPHFCAEQGHVLLHEAEAEGGARRWRIAKGRGRAAPR